MPYPSNTTYPSSTTYPGPGLTQQVVQTYMLNSTAFNMGVNGLSIVVAGWPENSQQIFDVEAAIVLANDFGRFAVCDNALKQALDDHPLILRVT